MLLTGNVVMVMVAQLVWSRIQDLGAQAGHYICYVTPEHSSAEALIQKKKNLNLNIEP